MGFILAKFLVITFSLLWVGNGIALAQPPNRAIESIDIRFKIKNAGFKVEGTLSGLEGIIRFDPEQLAESRMEVSLDARSIDTGIKLRDKHLRGKDYFDVELHPRIKMQSLGFTKDVNVPDRFNGRFELVLKGIHKEVSFPFTFDSAKGVFSGNFTLNRLDYNIGSKSWSMDSDVFVSIYVKTRR